MLQQLDLTQGSLCENLLAEYVGDLLDRNAFTSVAVGSRADDAICALAELFCNSIALINDKVLVEDLEDLPACHVTHDCVCPLGEGVSRGKDSRVRSFGERLVRLQCESRSVCVPYLVRLTLSKDALVRSFRRWKSVALLGTLRLRWWYSKLTRRPKVGQQWHSRGERFVLRHRECVRASSATLRKYRQWGEFSSYTAPSK